MTLTARRASTRLRVLLAMLMASIGVPALADAGWFESGDTQLRLDLQLLNDAEIILIPLNQWPLPRASVQYALKNAKEHAATNSAVAMALERVRARAASTSDGTLIFDTGIRGGQPGLWRDFDTLAREDGEFGAGVAYSKGRFAGNLEVTGVTDPDDGDELRLDGSHATVKFGNWLFSANALDRWWGPGHEGSLILSNNARPMPTVMVERAEARAPEVSWLRWIGPYRFSFGISQMENEREDIDAPLFMAWRVAIMPFRKVEIGFSRTAQFCGDQLACDLNTFGNMLAGNDNVGFDSTAETEPGNQMAGFDLRWNSPIGNLPYALYAQYVGEDESSYLPAKYLGQLGFEVWHPLADGGLVQVFAEYANTTCSGLSFSPNRGPFDNCAYNQGRFDVEGYRYKGRVIGYASDRDADNWALGGNFAAADGALWTATARFSKLNHDDIGDTLNTVASVPTDYGSVEIGWKGRLLGESFSIDLGVETLKAIDDERETEPYGFIGWRHEFDVR